MTKCSTTRRARDKLCTYRPCRIERNTCESRSPLRVRSRPSELRQIPAWTLLEEFRTEKHSLRGLCRTMERVPTQGDSSIGQWSPGTPTLQVGRRRARRDGARSNLQSVKVGDAGFHHFEVHFDEIIFYAAGLRGGEDFLPIERVLADGRDFFGLGRPALDVHGKEAAGILGEILGGVIALADRGDLELELDEPGIEKFKQHVVGAPAVHRRNLKVFIVKALLDAGLGGELGHFVVFVGGALNILQSGVFRSVEAGDAHLLEADVFRPGNAGLLILAKLLDAEVRTHAGDACIVENFAEFGSGIFGEAGEAGVGVTYRRTELNGLKSAGGKLHDCAAKFPGDQLADSADLAAYRRS